MQPFENKPLSEPNPIEKLLKKIPQKNFLVEVNNLLASQSLEKLSKAQIVELEKKYGVGSSYNKYYSELKAFLSEFLKSNFDNPYSKWKDYESAKLLQGILSLSDKDFDQEYQIIATEKFRTAIKKLIETREKCGDAEKIEIDTLATQYKVDLKVGEDIVNNIRIEYVQNYWDTILNDRRVSPEEIQAAERLSKDLNVDIQMTDKSKANIDKFQRLWVIENGELPIFEPDILLPKNETCHLICEVDLYESRKVTKRIGYAGPTARVKIMKGVYYRFGNLGVNRSTEEQYEKIDSGRLYITNKKILFKGQNVNKTYQYNQIIDIKPYTDGIELIKDSGKSPTFTSLNEPGDIIASTITRIMEDYYL